ncbi:hypothetical protein [Flavobacterium suncheonense]|uniref:Lipoprotein n=1 Tax=Flavobacterium suncheonense GH29-5 = DSM 17707 TaxID=1121899 RepID=A0A0A2M0P5_9FLAO|nr:hypothetical protein [Flavobacterium suncheonense]KGO85043.1 hypothetical protein Q764_14255 [Flavobacterium suncheonense GH29-5 = DSM 17707]
MRELIVFFIFLSFFGCKKKSSITSQVSIDSIFVAEKFNPSKIYSDSISLYYKGKSILQIGQSTEKLEKSLSFRPDPNLKHQNYWPYIIDYLSTDDFYTIKQTEGSINGIIFFSTNVEKKFLQLTVVGH